MTINQIVKEIIKEINEVPEEARQSSADGGPMTSWDEYKEQVQYEEYDSFEVFQETIESMVEDKISELSDDQLESLYKSLYKHYLLTRSYFFIKSVLGVKLTR